VHKYNSISIKVIRTYSAYKTYNAIVDYTSPALCTPVSPFSAICDAAYRHYTTGGPQHRHRQHAQKVGKDRASGSGDNESRRDSRHSYSAVSASEDFFDFALYKSSHYITLHILADRQTHRQTYSSQYYSRRQPRVAWSRLITQSTGALQLARKFFYYSQCFLQRAALEALYCYGNFVCLSVRPSHAGIVSKRRHVAQCSLHRRIAKCV